MKIPQPIRRSFSSGTAFKAVVVFVVLFFAGCYLASAQCAMCRASVESTLSEGNIGIASKLNTGIIYLFVIPYIAVAVVGFLWYKRSRENARKAEDILRRKKSLLGNT